MTTAYWTEAQRLEQRFANAYNAYRKLIESTPYPSTIEDWEEHERYRDQVSEASAAWDAYCSENKHLRGG